MIHSGRAGFGELLDGLAEYFGSEPMAVTAEEHVPVDVAVVGGGPAGVAAAIYSARKGLKTALIAGRIGGQVNDTAEIANLPSVTSISGRQLSAQLRNHSDEYDIGVYENRSVESLKSNGPWDHRILTRDGEVFPATQVIIATGASWRKLWR